MSCVPNPYYSGAGNETDYYDSPYYDTVTGEPCTPGGYQNPPRIPQILATPGGVTSNNNKLDSVLSTFLSALALVKGAKGVPTTLSNDMPPTVIYQQNPQGAYNAGGDGSNIAGQVQNLIQKNSGAVLIGGAIVVALFLKPPTKK